MAWFVVRDAFGEVLEATPCSDLPGAQERRIALAVRAWKNRGDTAQKLDALTYKMTSFDGNVRMLSIEASMPAVAGDGSGHSDADRLEHPPR